MFTIVYARFLKAYVLTTLILYNERKQTLFILQSINVPRPHLIYRALRVIFMTEQDRLFLLSMN